MISWFKKHAPIRRKFSILAGSLFVVGSINLFAALLVLSGTVDAIAAVAAAGATTILSVGMILVAKELITVPYVETVLRIEQLAVGDLDTWISYTDHSDCVGRMTRAMAVFGRNARIARKPAPAPLATTDEDDWSEF